MEDAQSQWFLTDRDEEIMRWIDDNLQETTYTIGRTFRNQRVMIVMFGSEADEILYAIRLGDASA